MASLIAPTKQMSVYAGKTLYQYVKTLKITHHIQRKRFLFFTSTIAIFSHEETEHSTQNAARHCFKKKIIALFYTYSTQLIWEIHLKNAYNTRTIIIFVVLLPYLVTLLCYIKFIY